MLSQKFPRKTSMFTTAPRCVHRSGGDCATFSAEDPAALFKSEFRPMSDILPAEECGHSNRTWMSSSSASFFGATDTGEAQQFITAADAKNFFERGILRCRGMAATTDRSESAIRRAALRDSAHCGQPSLLKPAAVRRDPLMKPCTSGSTPHPNKTAGIAPVIVGRLPTS